MRTGLALGKYAPFHAGHRLLIETALGEVDHLIVVVYGASSIIRAPLEMRAGWVRGLYPQAEVIEAPEGPEATGVAPEIVDLQNSFLLRLLAGRKIDAFYSSESYGAFVAGALGCKNRLVDPGRVVRSVSGTEIREALAGFPRVAAAAAATAAGSLPASASAHWDLHDAGALISAALSPGVRADLLPRVVFLGGPSSGKTKTAAALAGRLGEPLCLEYGREHWFAHQQNHRLSMADLETISAEQVHRERMTAAGARRVVVADTSPLTTLAYAKYYYGAASARLERAAASYHALDRLLVLCDTDIPFDDSLDRSGPGSRDRLQRINENELAGRGLPYVTASGTTEERVRTILTALEAWRYQC